MYSGTGKKKRGYFNLLMMLTVFICTKFIYTDFDIRQYIGYSVLLLFLISKLKVKLIINVTKLYYIILIITVLFSALLPNFNSNHTTNGYMLSLLLTLLYYVFSDPGKKEIVASIGFLQATSVVFAFLIVLFGLFPDLYWNYVFRFLSDITKEEALRYIPRGYGIPIGGQYPFANIIMSIGCFISFLKLKSNGISKGNTFALFISFIGLLFSGRRSETLVALIVLSILYFRSSVNRRITVTTKKVFFSIGIIFTSIAIVYFLAEFNHVSRISKTFTIIKESLDSSYFFDTLFSNGNDVSSGRIVLWLIALEAFFSSPLFGIGWGQFANLVPDSFNAVHGRGNVENVHNDYLQHFCEYGIFGGLIITVLTLNFIYQTWHLKITKDNFSDEIFGNFVVNVSLSIQLFFAILGLLDPCFYNSSYWVLYTIAIILFTAIKTIFIKEVRHLEKVHS